MDTFINAIGGYNSWQFCCLSFGLLVVGLALRAKWIIAIPIPFMGLILLFCYLNNQYNISAPNISNDTISGMASVMPILFFAIGSLVIIDPSVVGRVFGFGHKNKDDSKSEDSSKNNKE